VVRTLEAVELVGIHPRPPFLIWEEVGWRKIPGEVVEVVKVKRGDGRDLYEGRILPAKAARWSARRRTGPQETPSALVGAGR
jgi:hypothetical protein